MAATATGRGVRPGPRVTWVIPLSTVLPTPPPARPAPPRPAPLCPAPYYPSPAKALAGAPSSSTCTPPHTCRHVSHALSCAQTHVLATTHARPHAEPHSTRCDQYGPEGAAGPRCPGGRGHTHTAHSHTSHTHAHTLKHRTGTDLAQFLDLGAALADDASCLTLVHQDTGVTLWTLLQCL